MNSLMSPTRSLKYRSKSTKETPRRAARSAPVVLVPEPPGPTNRTIAQHSSGSARKRGLLPPCRAAFTEVFRLQFVMLRPCDAPLVQWIQPRARSARRGADRFLLGNAVHVSRSERRQSFGIE